MSDIKEFIATELERLNLCGTVKDIKTLTGGCISQALCYSTDKGDYFVKTNSDPLAQDWFIAESLALERINDAVPYFAPRPIGHNGNDRAYIVTEYVPMTKPNTATQKELGSLLAKMHAAEQPSRKGLLLFGFDVTSWCGTTQLDNAWSSDWLQFYRTQRLQPLLDDVRGQNEDVDRLGASLNARLEHWLGKDALGEVHPSLLHGDLWAGNMAARAPKEGENHVKKPLIFDPASFYGHNEFEFGIMKMFGGFTPDCFESYDATIINETSLPLVEEKREERIMLYEAYHHLNHYAMFGGSYGSGFVNLVDKLL